MLEQKKKWKGETEQMTASTHTLTQKEKMAVMIGRPIGQCVVIQSDSELNYYAGTKKLKWKREKKSAED